MHLRLKRHEPGEYAQDGSPLRPIRPPCKKEGRKNVYAAVQFDFLGYGFQPRLVRCKDGNIFVSYTPAISQKSAKSIREVMRSWRVHIHSDSSLDDIAKFVNPYLRGWITTTGITQGQPCIVSSTEKSAFDSSSRSSHLESQRFPLNLTLAEGTDAVHMRKPLPPPAAA
jgi:hypothetical protein